MEPRPVTYRAEIIDPLLTSLAAGECCSVIGVSGMGKSNMVQHMLRPDVLHHRLGTQAAELRFMIFDANMLTEWNAWGFFEALSESLLTTFAVDISDMLLAQLRACHHAILTTPGNYTLSFRLCSDILHTLCMQWPLVILFDEFDALFKQLSGTVLRNLRGLRDRHKYRLMYVTFSRNPLADLRTVDEWDEIEPFIELLNLCELGLHPLRDDDALAEVIRFAERHHYIPDVSAQQRIVHLSGGHPALLRALVQQHITNASVFDSNTALFQNIAAIRLECTKVWQQLSGEEQETLLRIFQGLTCLPSETTVLIHKGLVQTTEEQQCTIFSPVFEAYLKSMITKQDHDWQAPVYVELDQRIVYYYGRDITSELTPRDYALLTFLWKHQGHVCTLIDVAKAVYEGEGIDEDDDFERIQTRIRRLKKHLSSLMPEQPVPISVFRLGVRLGIISKADTLMVKM